MEKKEIRKELLKLRGALKREEVNLMSEKICENLGNIPEVIDAKVIYGYMPLKNEVDIKPVLKQILDKGKVLALPKVLGETMEFYQVDSLSKLEEGSFHVLEPDESCSLMRDEGVVFVPGVGFDFSGGRMGYGKGYYDKYFASHGQKLFKIGIAYKIQIIDTIPTIPTDVPLDGIVCESGFQRVTEEM